MVIVVAVVVNTVAEVAVLLWQWRVCSIVQ